MTQPNFYELIKKETDLIQRLEKILDKLESPIIIFPDSVNNSETQININKMFNGEPIITEKPEPLLEFKLWDFKKNDWYEPIFEAHKGNLHDVSICLNGRLQLRTIEAMEDESMFPNRFKVFQKYTDGEYREVINK